MRRTKIAVTLGPKSWDPRVIRGMIMAGADVFRINLSHVKAERDYDFLASVSQLSRKIAQALNKPVQIVADCPGHKFRLGQFVKRQLTAGDQLEITANSNPINGELPFPYRKFLAKMCVGQEILVGDGCPRFVVAKEPSPNVLCEVTLGGLLEPGKGLTVRGLRIGSLNLSAYTKKDEAGMKFAAEIEAEQVVVSYATSAVQTVAFAKRYRELGGLGRLVFKYELQEAGDELEGIVAATDEGYVGQGDLGLSIPHESIPAQASRVVRSYRKAGKPCKVGTQLLSSMKTNPFPQHGETSGIYRLVEQGASELVFSDETTMGDYPVRVVEVAAATILAAENYLDLV